MRGVRFGGEWHRAELGAVLDYMQPTPYLVDSTDYNDSYSIQFLQQVKVSFLAIPMKNMVFIMHLCLP
jgi:hypothetical protein